MTANSWQAFFDAHAPVYDDNVFTRNTSAEVDFLVEHLALAPGAAILSNISRSLRPSAPVALTTLSAVAMVRRLTDDDVAAGRFDPGTSVEASEMPPRDGLDPVAGRGSGASRRRS